ncbi:MAG TPA: hypothetical protein VGE16_10345 [Albitalea sp.]
MNTNTRLRIATRIHFALMRHLGEGIDVGVMLKQPAEAREVLWVCEASGDAELMALAHQYHRAVALEGDGVKAGGHAQQETPWSRDTSGFGLSQPPVLPLSAAVAAVPVLGREAPAASGAARWLKPATWLRRGQSPHR